MRILTVDDDPIMLELLTEVLASAKNNDLGLHKFAKRAFFNGSFFGQTG